MGRPATIPALHNVHLPGKAEEILQGVTEEGFREFLAELTPALRRAEETQDASAVQYVINAWWVSSLFFTHEDIEVALDTAMDFTPDDVMTADEIGEYLGIT